MTLDWSNKSVFSVNSKASGLSTDWRRKLTAADLSSINKDACCFKDAYWSYERATWVIPNVHRMEYRCFWDSPKIIRKLLGSQTGFLSRVSLPLHHIFYLPSAPFSSSLVVSNLNSLRYFALLLDAVRPIQIVSSFSQSAYDKGDLFGPSR